MQTLTLQPSAGIDSYITDASAFSNYGTETGIYVGHSVSIYRGLLLFDLSTLPAAANIRSATLTLYLTASTLGAGSTALSVYRCKRDWVESGVTWQRWKVGSDWSTAGANHADDRETSPIGALTFTYPVTVNQAYAIPLTGKTKSDLDLGYGWILKNSTEANDRLCFSSSDHATAGQRPMLVIQYGHTNRMLLGVGV